MKAVQKLGWLLSILMHDEDLITSAKIESRPCDKPIEGIMCKGSALIERTSDEENDYPGNFICRCSYNRDSGDH